LDFFTPEPNREVGTGGKKYNLWLDNFTPKQTERVAIGGKLVKPIPKNQRWALWFLLPDKPNFVGFVGICNPLSVAHVG
jgi:hypothetical protein